MATHQQFHYKSIDELKAAIKALNLEIPIEEQVESLRQSIVIAGKSVPNRLAINPMEGCDGKANGEPDELTLRRYRRFAKGGSGLLWFEATAVVPEGRANPRQLWINEDSVKTLAVMRQQAVAEAQAQFGKDYTPYTVLQLTHSGRYSKPTVKGPAPIIAGENPYLDPFLGAPARIISDEELEDLEEKYVKAAELAVQAGFDAIDIKACHGYLISELLGAHTRQGKYGGSFENRTRFIINVVSKIKAKLGDKITLASRMNAYDSVSYPYGWGVSQDDFHVPDYAEPIKLAKLLYAKGVCLIDITCGNPYYNPHVNRPYDFGGYVPPFHQLENTTILLNSAKQIKMAVPELVIVGSGLSWLRQFGAQVAAGCVAQGWFDFAGFGRQAFAYPDYAKDILQKGHMEENKVCLACSKCTCMMRDGGVAGCVPRDAAQYAQLYLAGRQNKPPFNSDKPSEHI